MRKFLAAALLGMTQLAMAHPLAPALLQLDEIAPARYAVLWRTPVARLQGREVTPLLPAECRAQGAPEARLENGEALVSRWIVQCPSPGLEGRTLSIDGIEASGINVVVQVQPLAGDAFKGLIGADPHTLTIGREMQPVFARYLELGGEHLLTGTDHLLFLLGLFVLVGSLRRLVVTVTAFTLGHSFTLALAVLDIVQVRQAYAEIAIALTVLLLALEIVRAEPRSPAVSASLMRRKPWLMAGAFGLVHGLGFAGALREVGLPPRDIPQALLAFNLGIEAAQLALIALLLAIAAVARRMPLAWRASPAMARVVPAYFTGSMAVCWCLERSAALFG